MAITFHKGTGQFHLYNQFISYIFKVGECGQLCQIYYGKRITDKEDFGYLIERGRRDMAPCPIEGNELFSLENTKQEYPVFGGGDPRYGAYDIERRNGSHVVEFRYKGHKVYRGKPKLRGLPATYTESEDEAQTLEITLEDQKLGTRIILLYTIFTEAPVLTKSVRFVQDGAEEIVLHLAMSGCLDLPDKEYVMIDLCGAWARERHIREHRLDYGVQSIHSMRGSSSHQFNPFLALKRENTDEFSGEVIGFSLVYSGNFLGQVEVDNYDVTRVLMGIHPQGFDWRLRQGEEFQTPELVMVYSERGLNGMSQCFHKLYRTRLARGCWRDRERPILINNWEATYFNFDEDKIVSLAGRAKQIGAELFVMDDGWFGKRDDATTSLGDWFPNKRKLPNGLKSLVSRITALGMKFGIWIEPEMVNKDSELYRAHPDWVLADTSRTYCHGRNQYMLDFSRREVRDYIFDTLEQLFADIPLSYVKWDMNRNFSEVYSNGTESGMQGRVRHEYVLGVYELYERLTSRFPEILFESCASGGARFDPGILYYAPQGWVSDNTDAVSRLAIQYGTSHVYPVSSMGSHVSAAPNHQTYRNTSLETRGNAAYFGAFGYELDLERLSEEDLRKMSCQAAFVKKYRKLIHQGTFYRLLSPFSGNETAWMVVSDDQSEAILAYFRVLQPVNAPYRRIRLAGLSETAEYAVSEFHLREENETYEGMHFGDELMYAGFSVSDIAAAAYGKAAEYQGDYLSRLFHLKAK